MRWTLSRREPLLATWFGDEGEDSKLVQHGPVDLNLLNRLLTRWMLARTVGKGHRNSIIDFLNNTAREKLLEASEAEASASPFASAGCKTVEQLSAQVKADGLLPGRPTSLISKFAFLLRPDRFVPYDSRVRGALKTLGYRIEDHHYCDYVRAFHMEKAAIVKRCRGAGLTPAKLRYLSQTLDDALFDARLADKRLMLEGGFSASRMQKDFQLSDFSEEPWTKVIST